MAVPVFGHPFSQDINKPVQTQHGGGLVFTGDALSDSVSVALYDDGEALSFSGSVVGSAIRADGETVEITGGTITGNVATITLPASCFVVPGPLSVVLTISDGTTITTALRVLFTVVQTETGTIVDPGSVVPNVSAITAEYANMQAAVAQAEAAASTAISASYVFSDAEIATFRADGAASVLDNLSISAGGVSPTAGTNIPSSADDYAATCKLGYTNYIGPLLVMIDNADFQWNVWIYTNKGTSYKIRSVTNKDYTTGPVILPEITSGSNRCFRIGFKRIDGTAVTAEMMAALVDQISFYQLTDTALTTSGAAADAKAVGDRLATDETAITGLGTRATALEAFQTNQSALNKRERYRCIQWKKNNSPNATGAISSMTVIGDKLYVFKYTSENEDVSDNKAYPINADGTVDFANGVTFTSNLGHANTVNWNPLNGSLLTMRAPTQNDTNDGKRTIIIIPSVTSTTTAFDRTASGSVNIDLDLSITVGAEKAFGDYRINAIWGPNTILEAGNSGSGTLHSDLIYVVSDDSSSNASGKRRLALLQLATGSNTSGFSYGTAVTADAGVFNGKYNILQVWTQEWTAVNGLAQGNNDATYHDGLIYEIPAPISVAGFPFMIHSFDDFGLSWKTKRIMIPLRSLGGTATDWEKGGIAIYNGHMYVGSKSAGLFVFEF